MLKRKLKKLVRDPKLFITDMIKKNQKKIKPIKKIEFDFGYKYSVVAAVYNSEKYLDDFFSSLTKQTLNFKKHIKIILVNDGSVDDSEKKIKHWMERYPNNITYIYKENGGQASARNLGLEKVDTEWVSFIDPDDFVNKEYFFTINKHIDDNHLVDIVSCKMVVYKEESKTFGDTQPLRFCFEKDETTRDCKDLDDLIQLSASSALFKTQKIKSNNVIFNHEIKPNFEDGKFVIDYMSYCTGKIIFLNKPNYYYRVRGDGSSTTNTQWEKKEKYSNVLEFGLLEMLKNYHQKANGKVPRFAQRTALYFLIQYFNRILNTPQSVAFLDKYEKDKLLQLLDSIFIYIDDREILKFNLLGAWFFHKIGMQALFKSGEGYNFQIAYVKNHDSYKKEVQISYFCKEPSLEEIKINNANVFPAHVQTIRHDFLGRNFCERLLWIKYDDLKDKLSVKLHANTEISIIGQSFKKGVSIGEIKNIFINKSPSKDEEVNTWLFMDSDTRADDNAEHLYRYVKKQQPHIDSFFALRKSSKDWDRLSAEGFNLVDFESEKFGTIYNRAGVLLSSHIDRCFTSYNGKYSLANKKFIFLQHGVTKDNISQWLNNTCRIDGILTSTNKEYFSFSNKDSEYNFDTRNILLTGMPRYDNLSLQSDSLNKSAILIMPTWRRELAGKTLKNTSTRSYNEEFKDSEYFSKWQEILNSKMLKEIHLKFGKEVIFTPHPNLIPYINEFEIPDYIEIVNCQERQLQDIFSKTDVLITDYSSVAFDIALSGGKIIYYQFDEEQVFSGLHTYSRGYYNYHTDGFGPVTYNHDQVLDSLADIFSENSKTLLKPAEDVFSFIDNNNCARSYHDIVKIINPHSNVESSEIYYDYALMASNNNKWDLALERWNILLEREFKNAHHISEAKTRIVDALIHQEKITQANDLLVKLSLDESFEWSDFNHIQNAKIELLSHNWSHALASVNKMDNISDKGKLIILQCFAEENQKNDFEKSFKKYHLDTDSAYSIMCTSWRFICHEEWSMLSSFLEENISIFNNEELIEYKPLLILARSYQELGDYETANSCLERHELYDRGNILLRYQIAKLAFDKKQWGKVISQLSAINITTEKLPESLLLIYLRSLRLSGKLKDAEDIINLLSTEIIEKDEFILEIAEVNLSLKNWNISAEYWMKLVDINENANYKLAFIYRRLGMVEEGLSLLIKPGLKSPETLEEWVLRAELAELSKKWDEANYCWESILRYYSETAPAYCWERLSNNKMLDCISKITDAMAENTH